MISIFNSGQYPCINLITITMPNNSLIAFIPNLVVVPLSACSSNKRRYQILQSIVIKLNRYSRELRIDTIIVSGYLADGHITDQNGEY